MKGVLPLLLIGFLMVTMACGADRPAAEIVDYGIYKGELNDPIIGTNMPTGLILRGRGLSQLDKQTTEIPAVLGTQFGFRFVIHGKPDEDIKLHLVWLYPGITNSATRRNTTRFEVDCRAKAEDKTTGIMWTFTDKSELVAGPWTFQVYRNDERLLEKQFQVK